MLGKVRAGAAPVATRSSAKTILRSAPNTASRTGAIRHVAAVPKRARKTHPTPGLKLASRTAAPRQVATVSRRATKTNPYPSLKMVSAAAKPRETNVVSSSVQPLPRQDLGYVEKANGKVEAIVAEAGHVRLVPETKSFAANFHAPAPTWAALEVGRAPSSPPNPPASAGPGASPAYTGSSTPESGDSSPAAVEVDAAAVPEPRPVPGNNNEPKSEDSAALQSEPLADYAGDQFPAKPPEALQPSPCPVLPAPAPVEGVTRSTVNTLGYVEKVGGEKEAIVEVLGQIYLVHEGELFAEKYRALRVSPTFVEIVEEPIKTAAALPERRRKIKGAESAGLEAK